MLGSEQPGEAEAARRKLLEHLATQRLSLTDLAIRLRDGAGGETASFTEGARVMSLERQLAIARAAKQEAEIEARQAQAQAAEMRQALQQAAFDVGRALKTAQRAKMWSGLGWTAATAAMAVGVILFQRTQDRPRLAGMAPGMAHAAPGPALPQPDGLDDAMRPTAGERVGTVRVQDLAIRLSPSDDAGIRAFLNRGTRVVIAQQVRLDTQTWLLVRSVSGTGWVRGVDILR